MADASRNIEHTYKMISDLPFEVLRRPEIYVGSTDKVTQMLSVYENDKMVHRFVTYVPALYHIFNEILQNAADKKQRSSSMNLITVDINLNKNKVTVYNNGDEIPVVEHKEAGILVPDLVFGQLPSGSNYDHVEGKTTAGCNGYGAKLANLFSRKLIVEITNGKKSV